MNQDEMYEDVRAQMRGKVQSGHDPGYTHIALTAIYNTLTKAGSICLPFFLRGDDHLYVRCDEMPFSSIKMVEFIANANFLTCKVVAMNRLVDLDGEKHEIPTPYINIYKEK